MCYLILSDIHSNLEALEAALEQARDRYDRVVCLGDVVGYGPNPNEVTERVRALEPAIVRGNHDKASAGITDASDFNPAARFAAEWTHRQLTAENLAYIRSLPSGPKELDGFEIVHGSPGDEDDYLFMAREAFDELRQARFPLTFFGHTHYQGGFLLRPTGRVEVVRVQLVPGTASAELTFEPDTRYLINPGSIGQPRDGDPRAAFALYEPERQAVTYWRVPYDIPAVQQKMMAAGLPESLSLRLSFGR